MKTLIKIVSGGLVVAFALALSVSAFAQAELEAEKTPDKLIVGPGGAVAYTIVVRNTGDEDAASVMVTDDLDDDMNFVSSTPSPSTQTASTVTWDLGTVAAGGSESIVVNVSLDSSFTGPTVDLTGNKILINRADVDGSGDLEATGQSVIEGRAFLPPAGDGKGGGLPTTGIPVAAAVMLGAGALLGIKWAFATRRS